MPATPTLDGSERTLWQWKTLHTRHPNWQSNSYLEEHSELNASEESWDTATLKFTMPLTKDKALAYWNRGVAHPTYQGLYTQGVSDLTYNGMYTSGTVHFIGKNDLNQRIDKWNGSLEEIKFRAADYGFPYWGPLSDQSRPTELTFFRLKWESSAVVFGRGNPPTIMADRLPASLPQINLPAANNLADRPRIIVNNQTIYLDVVSYNPQITSTSGMMVVSGGSFENLLIGNQKLWRWAPTFQHRSQKE